MHDSHLAAALARYTHLVGHHRLLGVEAAVLVLAATLERILVPPRAEPEPELAVAEAVPDRTEIVLGLAAIPDVNITIPQQAIKTIRERYVTPDWPERVEL